MEKLLMNNVERQVISKLVGLARATIGNEDLITTETINIIIKALSSPNLDIINDITIEKRKLVPNCFYCSNPCGRTEDPVINELSKLKSCIYSNLTTIINSISRNNTYSDELYNIIFTSLFYLGEKDFLDEIIDKQQQFIKHLKKL